MDTSEMVRLGKPCFYLASLTDDQFANLQLQLIHILRSGVVRVIRGSRSRTLSSFFDEASAALQFPYYFGRNWNAFSECIADLEWAPGDAYVVMLAQAHLLLSDADEDFRILLRILDEANTEWLTPNQYYPRNRHPTPFHVVLQSPIGDASTFGRSDLELLQLLDSASVEFGHLEQPYTF